MEGDRIDEKIREVVGRASQRGAKGFRYLETSARLMASCFALSVSLFHTSLVAT